MSTNATQAQRLFSHLRRRGHTTMEMLQLGISVSPWKRLSEGLHHLKPGERLVKSTNARGLVVYRVMKA
jgi:hypothetical protein